MSVPPSRFEIVSLRIVLRQQAGYRFTAVKPVKTGSFSLVLSFGEAKERTEEKEVQRSRVTQTDPSRAQDDNANLSRYRFYPRQRLSFKVFQHRSPTRAHVAHLFGKAKLINRGNRVTAAD